MLLKTDWFAIAIATFGVGVVVYYGWDSRKAYPPFRKLIYGLLGLMTILWILIILLLLGDANAR